MSVSFLLSIRLSYLLHFFLLGVDIEKGNVKWCGKKATAVGDQQDYAQFVKTFQTLTGIDLAKYKEAQMKRRITSLYEKRGFSSFRAYTKGLQAEKSLLIECVDRMTINVSEFFRNPTQWGIFQQDILPAYASKQNSPVSVWSAACSTGEEPYTLAMILSDLYPLSKLKVLATDLDNTVLEHARHGIYTEKAIREVDKSYRDLFLEQKGILFHVKSELKRSVQFQKHNLLHDPYPKQMDCIVCRNVLIYFTEEAKEKVYRSFHESLKQGGVLFVGSTEQMFHPERFGFRSIRPFFYEKI